MSEDLFYKSAGITKESTFGETVKGCFEVGELPTTPDRIKKYRRSATETPGSL